MSVETAVPTIASTAANSAVAVESPAVPISAVATPEVTGGITKAGFSLTDLQALPELRVNTSSINLDRQVPVPELISNPKLFETVYQAPPEIIDPLQDAVPNMASEESTGPTAEIPTSQTQAETQSQKMDVLSTVIPKIMTPTEDSETVVKALKQEEIKVDTTTIGDTIVRIQESTNFTEEEKNFWQTKFQRIAEEKGLEEAAESTTRSYAKSKTAVETATQNSAIPPEKPPEVASAVDETQEPEPPTKRPEWDLYVVENEKRVDEDSLKKRFQKAKDIIHEPAQGEVLSPKVIAQKDSYRLDIPDENEAARILQGQLEYPAVAHIVQASLEFVDENDSRAVQKAVNDVIKDNEPKEKQKTPSYLGRVEQEDLPGPAQALAQKGAEKIIYRQARAWQETKHLKLQEPIELEKVENA